MHIAGAVEHPNLRSCIRMADGTWGVRGRGDKQFTKGATLTAALAAWHAKQTPVLPSLPPLPAVR